MLELDQILLWVVGYAVHDEDRYLCMPDFACCVPTLLTPREVREAYLAAYMRQFDEDEGRAADARLMVERMNLRFLALRVQGLGAYVVQDQGGPEIWERKRSNRSRRRP